MRSSDRYKVGLDDRFDAVYLNFFEEFVHAGVPFLQVYPLNSTPLIPGHTQGSLSNYILLN